MFDALTLSHSKSDLVALLVCSELCLTGMFIFDVIKSMNIPAIIVYLYVSLCVHNLSF